jgi:pilus assembly protein CpaB
MRARTLFLLFLALLLAVGTIMLARSYLTTQQNKVIAEQNAIQLAPTPGKDVLVAHVDLKRGQILRPEDLSWQIWPEGALDRNYVVRGAPPLPARTPESFTGWVARDPIPQGEPITEARIIAPGNRGFLAAVLRPGTRAISIPVTITSGIAGFIFPGDQVDLMLTFTIPPSVLGLDQSSTSSYEHKAVETLLRDVRVIAIDQRLESKPGEAVPAHTATLEVTPKQGEIIALASKMGEMFLTLRSLVPAPHETLVAGPAADATASRTSPDSPVVDTATCTIDSDVNPLLPKVLSGQRACTVTVITILRGSAKGSESSAPTTTTGKGS